MRGIYFFLPGVSEKYQSGGLRVALQTRDFFTEIFKGIPCEVVTTHERSENTRQIHDVATDERVLCVVTWGPLVAEHVALIKKNLPNAEILYYAQSFGWNVTVPAGIPIICVSRFVMSQWALYAKGNFVGYVPPAVDEVFINANRAAGSAVQRDIDVLVHLRKQNAYCINHLIPALQKAGLAVEIINTWIDQKEFARLLQRSKVFLYATELHKAGLFRRLPGEGFGLPALEALISGCHIASNLLGGVTDFLTPGLNCIKVDTGNLANDVRRIQHATRNVDPEEPGALLDQYTVTSVEVQWRTLIYHLYGHS